MLRKSMSVLGIVVFIFILLLILYAIELYSDDFYYVTFLDNGISGFIKENINHYQNVNGRVIVHLLDEIILKLGKFSYMIFLPILLILIFYLSAKIFDCMDNILYNISISSLLFLHITVYVLKETSFWITGAFNYIFPIFTALSSIIIVRKIISKNKLSISHIILLFSTSATTEQGFMMTFIFSLGIIILESIKNKKFEKKMIAILIIELFGFLTIFLSPASRLRASTTHTIFNYPILKLFEDNFGELSLILVGNNSIAILISILLLSIGLLYFKDRGINKTLLLGIPLGILIFALHILDFFTETSAIIATISIIVYILVSIIILFRNEKYQMLALFLTVAFCSQGVAFGLGEVSYRTLFPLTILSIFCISSIISKLNIKLETPLFFVFLITGICYITPTCIGYYNNKNVIDDMKASIQNYKKTGEININVDINDKYSHVMGYENANFLDLFYKYYGISNYKKDIYYNLNGDDSILYINNQRIRYSACLDNGNIYLPSRFVIESLGGTCEWSNEKVKYTLKDYYVIIDNITQKIIDCSNPTFIGVDLSNSIKQYVSRSYININDITYIINNTKCKITVGNKNYNY